MPRVRYWRELSEAEQQIALKQAEKFFSEFATPLEIQRRLTPERFKEFRRLAQKKLKAFDLPSWFSARAREGLLGSLIVCAADEEKSGQPYPDERVAAFHALLLRED